MKFDLVEVKGHKIIRAIYYKNDIADVFARAKIVSKEVNPHTPGGILRTDAELLIKNIGGLLSEQFISDILNSYAKSHRLSVTIENSSWDMDNSLYQIDHTIVIKGIKKTIETRSSFCYKTKCPERVITGAFSIIGPYISQSKPKEIYKDFYAFVFFCINPSDLVKAIKSNGITIYFAGGADISLLLSKGQVDSLKQTGAKYHVIKPITNALDAHQFLAKLFSDHN